jgi:two-component system, LytTR family, sensor kinase
MASTLPLPNVTSVAGPAGGLRSAVRRVALLFALATGLGVGFAWQTIMSLPPDRQATDWLHILVLQLVFWYIWVALTPAAFAVAERTRLDDLGTRRRVAAWLLLAVCVAVVQTGCFIAAQMTITYLRGEHFTKTFGAAWWWYFRRTIPQDAINFGLIAAAYHVLQGYRRDRERERVQADLRMRLATAELGLLRMQLQPHFLFNVLNTVSSLMETDTARARTLLADVGHLFRLSLERLGRQEVRLVDEIDFIRRYLDVQKVRFGDRLEVHISLDPELEDVRVPSLILQPLVENAVRHGVEPRRGIVVVRVAARAGGEHVHLTVDDEGDATAPAPKLPNEQGIGLRNTRSRLLQLYGSDAAMNVSSTDAAYRVTMTLPIRTTPAPSSR